LPSEMILALRTAAAMAVPSKSDASLRPAHADAADASGHSRHHALVARSVTNLLKNSTETVDPDSDDIEWKCMEAFPKLPADSLTGLKHATNRQKCEAGNLLSDGKTYMYNDGRQGDVPGVCLIGGCWCCVREQRKLHIRERLGKCDYTATLVSAASLQADFFAGRNELRKALKAPNGYTSCAVVGSSGKLLHGKYGNAIDDHQMVMRVNTAPTVGFESHSGARTTHRVMATTGLEKLNSDNCDSYGCRSTTSAEPWCPVGSIILNSWRTDAGLDPKEEPLFTDFSAACGGLVLNVTSMNAQQRHIMQETLTPPGFNFMSGLAGLLMAAMLCEDGFDVYGFDTGKEPDGTKYHYFDDIEVAAMDDFAASRQLLSNMAAAQPECIRTHE